MKEINPVRDYKNKKKTPREQISNGVKVFSGKSHPVLAERICQKLGVPLGSLKSKEYKNGCFELIFEQDICQKTVFLVQTSLPDSCNLHKNIWELFQMISFAKNCNAQEIIVVMPYVSYARSDKIYTQGMGINAKLLARLLESSGMTGFIGIDFHSDEFERFFSSKLHHLSAIDLLAGVLEKRNPETTFILPADMGALKKCSILAAKLGMSFGRVEKERISDTEVQVKKITGEFADKDVIIFDDEISTGTTLKTLAKEVERRRAKSITFVVTHGLFVGDVVKNFQDIKKLTEIIVTDTIPISKEIKESLPLRVVSISNLLAERIKKLID